MPPTTYESCVHGADGGCVRTVVHEMGGCWWYSLGDNYKADDILVAALDLVHLVLTTRWDCGQCHGWPGGLCLPWAEVWKGGRMPPSLCNPSVLCAHVEYHSASS